MSEADAAEGFVANVEREAMVEWCDALLAVADEAGIECSPQMIRSRVKDPANVACIDASVEADVERSGDCVAGVNLKRFRDCLDVLGAETISLVFDDAEREIQIGFETGDITLGSIPEGSLREAPDEVELDEFEEVVRVPAADFSRWVACANVVGDSFVVEFKPGDGVVLFSNLGDDSGRVTIEVDCRPSGDARSIHSLDYLSWITDSLPDQGTLQLDAGDDYPLRIRTEADDLTVDYLIAPLLGPRGDDS